MRIAGEKYAPAAEHDLLGLVEVSRGVDDADGAIVSHDDPVDERVERTTRLDAHGKGRGRRAPRSSVCRRRRSPDRSRADGLVVVVQVVEDREAELMRRLDEREVEGAGIVVFAVAGRSMPALVSRKGSRLAYGPAGAPLVVVCRTFPAPPCTRSRTTSPRGTFPPSVLPSAAPAPQRCVGAVVRASRMSGGQRPSREWSVVGAGLEQADVPVGVLAQARRQDAPRRSATHDDDVEAHGPRIRRGRYPQRVSPLDVLSTSTRAWFERAFEGPTPAQALGWPAIATGGHVLIQAPTGSGKTLAAFLLGPRPAERDAGRGAAAALRLAAEGPQLRHRAEPPQPPRRARLEAPGGGSNRRHAGRGAPPDAAHPAGHPHHDARVALPPAHLAGARDAARRGDGDPRRGPRGRGVEARVAPGALAGAPRAPRRRAVPAGRPLGDAAAARGDRPVRGGHRARDRARRRGRPQGARPPGRRPRRGHARARLDRPSSPCRRSRTASRWASASSAPAARSGRRSTRRSSSSFVRIARPSSSSTTAASPSGSRCGSTSSPRRSSPAHTTGRSRGSSGSSSRSS